MDETKELKQLQDRATRLVDAIREQRQAGHSVSSRVALAAGELQEMLDDLKRDPQS